MRKLSSILCAMILMVCMVSSMCPAQASDDINFSFLPKRTYGDVLYEARPPADITTALLIGYDHVAYGEVQELHGYSNGGQSDFLLLVVMDHAQRTIRTLQINRDTVTPVMYTDNNGNQQLYKMQICLSHAYGDTREKNNANTVLAVETLLGIEKPDDGAQIDWYMSMDISGISKLNDLLGGVTVTLEDDISAYDPAMTKGATIRLQGMQAEYYCRGRYKVGEQTNVSRMRRQRQYMNAAGAVLVERLRENPDFGSELLDDMGILYDLSVPVTNNNPFSFADPNYGTPTGSEPGRYLMTNESQAEIVALLARVMDYERVPVETLPGVSGKGAQGYMEFITEENAGLEWVLQTLYRAR